MTFPTSKKSYTPVTLSPEELKEIFLAHAYTDDKGQKLLGRDQLKAAFQYLGALMPTNEAESALRVIDRDGDGTISGDDEIKDLVRYASRYGYR